MENVNVWEIVQKGIESFTDDFFKDGRMEEIPCERESLDDVEENDKKN